MSSDDTELGRAVKRCKETLEQLEKAADTLERRQKERKTAEADPEFWPPQVGDVWETDGGDYFVRESFSAYLIEKTSGAGVSVWFAPGFSDQHSPEHFKNMNPRLKYRDGEWPKYRQKDEASGKAAEADPEFWPPQVGDVWETDDSSYFVRSSNLYDYLIGDFEQTHWFAPDIKSTTQSIQCFKALNPRLAYRRGER